MNPRTDIIKILSTNKKTSELISVTIGEVNMYEVEK